MRAKVDAEATSRVAIFGTVAPIGITASVDKQLRLSFEYETKVKSPLEIPQNSFNSDPMGHLWRMHELAELVNCKEIFNIVRERY